MSSTGFYSRKQQFLREWRVTWRMHWLDTLLGGLYVLIGFYMFHMVGFSQVFDVIWPFIIASIVVCYLASAICTPQSSGKTLPFYFNLPRNRIAAWDAQFAYLACTALWLEGIILAGAMLKIGGAGLTLHYRLHLELFCLPFLAIASTLSYLHIRHSIKFIAACLLAIVAFSTGLYYWIAIGFWEDAEKLNNYFPSRGFAVGYQCAFAALLLVSAAVVLIASRRHWQRREVGEIK